MFNYIILDFGFFHVIFRVYSDKIYCSAERQKNFRFYHLFLR